MKIIATIEGEQIVEHDDGSVTYKSKAAIDTDGSGPLHGDPDAMADTSLHQDGKALNADIDKYIVVPPAIIDGVEGVVMGCQAHLQNQLNWLQTDAVVGDIGPHKKLGEISRATAMALDIDPSPISGGMDEHKVFYTIYPGRAAVVDGKQYTLQPK